MSYFQSVWHEIVRLMNSIVYRNVTIALIDLIMWNCSFECFQTDSMP